MTDRRSPQLGDFPFSVELATRFDDLDTQGHVNNVAIANLYQESRVQFHRETFRPLRQSRDLDRDPELATVLADVHIAYRLETHYPYPVTLGCGVSRLGNSSYTISTAMFQKDACVGTCEAVLVFVKQGRPHPIPDKIRTILSDYLLPEQQH